jgi:hypothetical protein
VRFNGTNLPTTYVSSSQLTAVVTSTLLATPTTADVTVFNGTPGGGTSNPQTLFVPLTGAKVSAFQSISDTNPQAAVTGLSAGATGAGTLTVAQYSANPGTTCCRVGVPGSSSYFDVHTAAGNSFSTVTITDCTLGGGSQVLWYDTSTATWAPASNQSYDASSGCATVTVDSTTQPSLAQLAGDAFGVANLPPTWVSAPDQTQDYHDALSFSLTATNPEPGDALKVSVDSGSNLPAGLSLTDHHDGTATVAGTVQAPAGDYPVTFDVSDGINAPVPQTVTIHVRHEETTLSYTGAALIATNRAATLSAILKEDGSSAPVPAGQTVTLAVGSGSGAQSCQAQTAADGTVSCQIATVNQPLGNQPVSASFAGDSHYAASSDSSQQRLVFGYLPAGGGFALGDKAVARATSGTTLTWWGSQWSALNPLSGGAAPTSFKGFAQTFPSGTDPACGGTWTTITGNSAAPPSSVPAYMAVVVPSKVTQSGTTTTKISGDIRKIVIVKTNAGYRPDPSYPGTGTVVATLCGS